MSDSKATIAVGQFSQSPVLAVARAMGLDKSYRVDWTVERVPSSPGQFDMLRGGQIDLAITSPDNVLLYASTAENPLGSQLPLRLLRPIDRGLGLALYTSPSLSEVEGFQGATLGVDVMSSGFALLLLSMLKELGVDTDEVEFEAHGATPKRLLAVLDGAIQGTILNAESAVKAEGAGLRRWLSSVDIDPDYLGTVLVQMGGPVDEATIRFLEMWEEAVQAILGSRPQDVIDLLDAQAPELADAAYVGLLQSAEFGLVAGSQVTQSQLEVHARIRQALGAYVPPAEAIAKLVAEMA